LEGSNALAFSDGDDLAFQVSCRAAAGAFDETVPYAFVVTWIRPKTSRSRYTQKCGTA
jgi:hypothetical protein